QTSSKLVNHDVFETRMSMVWAVVVPRIAKFDCPLDDLVAEAAAQVCDGLSEDGGAHRRCRERASAALAEAQLLRAFLEVGNAHSDQPHGSQAVLCPRALEEGRCGSEEVVGKVERLARAGRTGDCLEGREAQLERDCAGGTAVARKVGGNAFTLPAKHGPEAVARWLVVVEGRFAADRTGRAMSCEHGS